ncbi:MAG: 50S ribosomal protein L18 [Phycisphaerales bacterium]|nr:50S ribosomal protein L18 [Phycisphaerales bacterium]MCB9837257.1 50S ribosomal protein L18 [Phycisphaera sp.]
MNKNKLKAKRHWRRRKNARKTLSGTADQPRLAVYRSLNHVYAQVIDDLEGNTIASASTRDKGVSLGKTGNSDAAKEVGKKLAEKALAKGVKRVVFDRGGFQYHGRVKALAEGAREGGLQF